MKTQRSSVRALAGTTGSLVLLATFLTSFPGCGKDARSASSSLTNDTAVLATKEFAAVSESLPAAKATARVGAINILDAKALDWTPIMTSQMKTANLKDLIIDVSLECGLLTKTLVRSKTGTSDTSSAEASVLVRVLIDGQEAKPGVITFCKRTQELTAVFGGILQSCQDADANGVIEAAECSFTDEELSLMLSTMSANAFNFVFDGVASGTHQIVVEAKIGSQTSYQLGSAEAKASIGRGAVTVEEVRMIKDDPISL